jgi:hypothetical protein
MHNIDVVTNLMVIIMAITLISMYGLDMKEPYPPKIIASFSEAHIRFLSYVAIYLLGSMYNGVVMLVVMIGMLLLHIDYINLAVLH